MTQTPDNPTQDRARPIEGLGVVGGFVLGLAVVFVLWGRDFYAVSVDESLRVGQALTLTWASAIDAGMWLPLHRLVMAAGLWLSDDPVWTPRIVSALLGLVAMGGLVWLAHQLAGWTGAAVAAVLSATVPDRVILSAVPLSESLYLAALMPALACLYHWLEHRRRDELLVGSVLMALAAATRYEGWLFCFGALLMVFLAHRKAPRDGERRWIVVSAAVLGLVPVVWVAMHAVQNGDPLGFLNVSGDRFSLLHGDASTWGVSLPAQLGASLIRNLTFVGCFALGVLAAKNRALRGWLVVVAVPLVGIGGLSLAGVALPSHNFWRIAAPFGLLMVPFVAVAIAAAGRKVGGVPGGALVVGLSLSLALYFGWQTLERTQNSACSVHDIAAGDYLRGVLADPQARAAIDSRQWRYKHAQVASGSPRRVVPLTGADPRRQEARFKRSALVAAGFTHILMLEPVALPGFEAKGSIGPWVVFVRASR